MAAAPKAFVIGHPIAHSRSPMIHGHWLQTYGIAGSYERIDVAPEKLARFLREFRDQGFVGGNVTLPHKAAVFEAVDHATELARRLGAVNTLWIDENGRLVGDNTDVTGFTAGLDAAVGPDWAKEAGTALVLGAGGAARAIVAGLVDRGLRRIVIANRTPDRARELQALAPDRIEVALLTELPKHAPQAGLLVNTTSLGMKGQPPLELDLCALPAHAVVSDIVYVPLDTQLLTSARQRGLRTADGLSMLLHQAVPGFRRWFGETPEVTPDLRALVAADIERAR